jgi:DnaJ-class molecular chaperone
MDNKQAVEVIRSNWPDARYSTLREALELSIKLLEAEEPAQLSHNSAMPKLPDNTKDCSTCTGDGNQCWNPSQCTGCGADGELRNYIQATSA